MIYLSDPTSHRQDNEIGNLGDIIIKDAISDHLGEICPEHKELFWVELDAKKLPGEQAENQLILCGANILANFPYLNKHVWRPSIRDAMSLTNVLLFGVGWWKYQRKPDLSTRLFYQRYLSGAAQLHSVRDSYTLGMLNACGVANVVNTGCPTMWNLPDTFVFEQGRANTAVFTLTDYSQDFSADLWMVEYLLARYQRLVFFPQGTGDIQYLRTLLDDQQYQRIELMNRSIEDYNTLLSETHIDYIGTRLHGGIRALQKGRRAVIISVDNRAETVAGDTGLPIVSRTSIAADLPHLVDNLREFTLTLNRAEIEDFKSSLQRCWSIT